VNISHRQHLLLVQTANGTNEIVLRDKMTFRDDVNSWEHHVAEIESSTNRRSVSLRRTDIVKTDQRLSLMARRAARFSTRRRIRVSCSSSSSGSGGGGGGFNPSRGTVATSSGSIRHSTGSIENASLEVHKSETGGRASKVWDCGRCHVICN